MCEPGCPICLEMVEKGVLPPAKPRMFDADAGLSELEAAAQELARRVEANPIKSIQIVGTIDLGPRCDCGAEKCKTTHADWCSSRGAP